MEGEHETLFLGEGRVVFEEEAEVYALLAQRVA
jgi:hypothetical protein